MSIRVIRTIFLSSVAAMLVCAALFIPQAAQATGLERLKIKDVDVSLGGVGSTLALTEDGRLFVTGMQNYGEFGLGGERYDPVTQFTQVDISHIPFPVVDIISNTFRTFLLNEEGSVYTAGGYVDEDPLSQATFEEVPQTFFEGKSIVKVFRNLTFVVCMAEDGSLYCSGVDPDNGFLTFRSIALPQDGGIPVKTKQTMSATGGGEFFILDDAGKVWVVNDFYNFIYGNDLTLNWEPASLQDSGSVPPIKQMTTIQSPYFLAEDGRVLYTGYYIDLSGNYTNTDPGKLDYTDLEDVTEFVPFFSNSIHSALPNIKKTDGKTYFGRGIFYEFGVDEALIPDEYGMYDASLIPGAEGSNIFTISGWPSPPTNYAPGTYLKNGYLTAVNGDPLVLNGVEVDQDDELPALTITQMFEDEVYVLQPTTPVFSGGQGSVNPTSATLGPQQQRSIPVQARWRILSAIDQEVHSGVLPETGSAASLDISALNLTPGTYTLSFYRETSDAYTGTYIRSGSTASARFSIAVAGGDVTVKYVDENDVEIAAPEVLSGMVDDMYESTPKTIPGYTLMVIPFNAVGLFTEEPQSVVYIYSKDANGGGGGGSTDETTTPKPKPKPPVANPPGAKQGKDVPTGDMSSVPIVAAALVVSIGAIGLLLKARRPQSRQRN